MVLLVAFGIAGLLCGGAFLASFLADNPHLIPDFAGWLAGPAPAFALAPAPAFALAPAPAFALAPAPAFALAPAPARALAPAASPNDPVYCEVTRRWRNPANGRLVRAPR